MNIFLQFFIRQKKLALIFTLSIIAIGLLSLFSIQRDQFPTVDFEVMSIVTSYNNASPEDVEQNVTNPIEDEIKNITGIKNFTSISKENYSNITIILSQDVNNIAELKQEIRNAVGRVRSLPEEVSDLPRIIDQKSSLRSVLKISINSSNIPYTELRNITNSLANAIEYVSGVSEVVKDGYLKREIKIIINTESLNKYELSLPQIIDAIKKRNQRYTVGSNNDDTNEKTIVVLANFNNIEDIGYVIVKSTFAGEVIYLKDIASISYGNKKASSIVRINGNKGFILRIRKQEQADVIKTVNLVKEKVTEFENKHYDLQIFYSSDMSKYVRNRLDIVTNNGIIGLALILVVLGLFLSFKTAFWVALSLPVSLLGTVSLLLITGETINLISLAAIILVLGIVVDDSIIIAESIHYHKQLEQDKYKAVEKGFKRVIMPVITTILTTILAFSSMFLMSGIMGKFIYVIPVVVIFALTLSFLEVSIALPAHLASSNNKDKNKVWFNVIENIFERLLTKILKLHYLVIIIFVAILAVSLYFAATKMKFVLFPAIGIDIINAKLQMPIGTSLQQTETATKKVEALLYDVIKDDLDSITSNVGNNFNHITNFTIELIPSNDRQQNSIAILEQLKARSFEATNKGELKFSVQRPGPPQGKDIEINLLSNDNEIRRLAADDLEAILKNIKGVSNINRNDDIGRPRIKINIDFEKMAKVNVDFSTVNRYLKAAFSGISVTNIREDENDIDFRLYLGGLKQKETFLNSLKISNKQGYLVPLKQFSTIENIEGESNFNHFNGKRTVLISAAVDDKISTSQQVIAQALKKLNLEKKYPMIEIISEGGAKETEKSINDFKNAFIIAIFGIFLLLVLLFNSYSQPILVLSAIPFSVIGVIWAFFLHNEFLSFFAILGTLALVGVIVNDSLVMVSHLNYVKQKLKNNLPAYLWVAEGAKNRLRAVVMTSLTTLAGVLPLAYGIGGDDFILQPMVLALGYGLLFGTLVTLILLPCLYLMNFEITEWLTRKK